MIKLNATVALFCIEKENSSVEKKYCTSHNVTFLNRNEINYLTKK